MADLEIPLATGSGDNNTTLTDADSYDSQKKLCLETINKINEQCASSSLIMKTKPDMMLIKEIENKGYQVTYTLDYDNKREKPFMCRLRITNPSYQDAGSAFISSFEDNLKKLGFNQASLETEDNLKKLFSNLMKI